MFWLCLHIFQAYSMLSFNRYFYHSLLFLTYIIAYIFRIIIFNLHLFSGLLFLTYIYFQDYYIADASEDQVFLCVTHNKSSTHLYISDVTGTKYSLSLENVIYFNPKGAHSDTWLRYVI